MADVKNSLEKSKEKAERSSEKVGKANKITNSTKGKSPANSSRTGEKDITGSVSVAKSDDKMFAMLQQIQASIKEQDKKLSSVSDRMDCFEQSFQYDKDDGSYPSQYLGDNSGELVSEIDTDENANVLERKSAESRFSSMSKRFKMQEHCDSSIDETLAENVNNLFRNGIEEDRYNELVKDEQNARPENCESLVVVKTNHLIWDAISHGARTNDKKLQNIETSVVKAATILVKSVNKMAVLEQENEKYGELIENCNDVLAILGHSNRQINLMRRDLMKPEIKTEYAHLCTHSLPFTHELFGDDVSKTAKEIEDCAKISNKIHRGGLRGRPNFRIPYRGSLRGRSSFYRGSGRGMIRGGQSTSSYDPKNYSRRGVGKARM